MTCLDYNYIHHTVHLGGGGKGGGGACPELINVFNFPWRITEKLLALIPHIPSPSSHQFQSTCALSGLPPTRPPTLSAPFPIKPLSLLRPQLQVGGAVYMNAGANGSEASATLVSLDLVTSAGELRRDVQKAELPGGWGYRTSPFQSLGEPIAIASASFQLQRDAQAASRAEGYLEKRKQTQPVSARSAGCVFRNPEGGESAGALIQKAGLKGLRIGGAAVSDQHANFLVNEGNSKAVDILALIRRVKEGVLNSSGYCLETEIQVVPYSLDPKADPDRDELGL